MDRSKFFFGFPETLAFRSWPTSQSEQSPICDPKMHIWPFGFLLFLFCFGGPKFRLSAISVYFPSFQEKKKRLPPKSCVRKKPRDRERQPIGGNRDVRNSGADAYNWIWLLGSKLLNGCTRHLLSPAAIHGRTKLARPHICSRFFLLFSIGSKPSFPGNTPASVNLQFFFFPIIHIF